MGNNVLNFISLKLDDINKDAQRLTRCWIWLGIYSLIAAGLLSLLLAFSRTPGIQDLMPGTDFFHVALVVHVDLSVLIWFIACMGIMWSIFGIRQRSLWDDGAFYFALLGTVMISIAPFVGAEKAIMNNYVPVLQHPWFYCGLVIATTGMVIQAFRYIYCNPPRLSGANHYQMIQFALYLAAWSAIAAVVCIGLSFSGLPELDNPKEYFELLFWGGGHVLQFTHTIMMLLAWFLLAFASGSQMKIKPTIGMALFALVLVPLLMLPWLYNQPITSQDYMLQFTQLMKWGGLASLPLGILVLFAFFNRQTKWQESSHLRAALLCSLTLFAAGGVLGFLIKGSNTIIPAHYHGSIVGVTLAFMGIVYLLLPRLGSEITRPKMAFWQPYVLAAGQLMHITGLAWSGGYGVKRKVAGTAQGLEGFAQVTGMGLMGLGGLVAAIGGLMFLIVAISALKAKSPQKQASAVS